LVNEIKHIKDLETENNSARVDLFQADAAITSDGNHNRFYRISLVGIILIRIAN